MQRHVRIFSADGAYVKDYQGDDEGVALNTPLGGRAQDLTGEESRGDPNAPATLGPVWPPEDVETRARFEAAVDQVGAEVYRALPAPAGD